MTLIVLEGVDGCGKTRHADALADALRAQGINALGWHHVKPSPAYPRSTWPMTLRYAALRAVFADDLAAGVYRHTSVIVCDRWFYSTTVAALTAAPLTRQAMALLVDAEDRALPQVRTILLDAPAEVIAARMTVRGEQVPDHLTQAQTAYRSMAKALHWPIISTDRDPAMVTADLVAIVRGVLAFETDGAR